MFDPHALIDPHEAIERLLTTATPVGVESVLLQSSFGRVLADDATADRDQPPCDVSAMDGYAIAEGAAGAVPVSGEAVPGQPPPELLPGKAVRIFTGAPVPGKAWAVVPRERTVETLELVTLPDDLSLPANRFIRRRGENAKAGTLALPRGITIGGVQAATLAAFGQHRVSVHRRVRLAILVTGDELVHHPSPWQIRDANGPGLQALFANVPWLDVLPTRHAKDDRKQMASSVSALLDDSDVLLITGGVSMGDHDHTKEALLDTDCRLLYHGLTMRPGKPNLGAVGPAGQIVLGLPGNPMSVLTGSRLLATPALRKRAGFAEPAERMATVWLTAADHKTLHLWHYRPVRLTTEVRAELALPSSSGDTVGPAVSDGFVAVPPRTRSEGQLPFYPWLTA